MRHVLAFLILSVLGLNQLASASPSSNHSDLEVGGSFHIDLGGGEYFKFTLEKKEHTYDFDVWVGCLEYYDEYGVIFLGCDWDFTWLKEVSENTKGVLHTSKQFDWDIHLYADGTPWLFDTDDSTNKEAGESWSYHSPE